MEKKAWPEHSHVDDKLFSYFHELWRVGGGDVEKNSAGDGPDF